MKGLSTEHTFLALLPILFVLVALVGVLVFLPKNSLDTSSKAAPLIAKPTSVQLPTPAPSRTPEVACSDLYVPVCGTNNLTYSNQCAADQAKVVVAYNGKCKVATNPAPTRVILPIVK